MKWGIMLAAAMLGVAPQAQAEHLYPRDECAKLEGFEAFRMQLVTAVANRDAEMLRPVFSEETLLDFGGGSGWETLSERLTERDLWGELDKVLRLGCASSGDGEIAMPWAWSQDYGIEDAFSAWLTLGDAVPLREAPSADAPMIRSMRWEAVEQLGDWQGDEEFIKVRTKSGEEGYAAVAQMRHQLDYRLLASREDGRWQVTVFVAGD
ncbi:SH3 domain-containing protein [Parerythrobacter aestuarii]|uniref:SH3 domain-containing protein n=1 Tax=Parerythrobacter aestuarii TaxID=3020909 RepID=UPI0024DED3AF|nr:SH3 domain-containing protein [Parerythrobacter aestuarii]